MVDNILTVFFFIYVLYAFFMATPFGIDLMLYEDENNKPHYSIIILFILAIPAMFAGCYIGIIK